MIPSVTTATREIKKTEKIDLAEEIIFSMGCIDYVNKGVDQSHELDEIEYMLRSNGITYSQDQLNSALNQLVCNERVNLKFETAKPYPYNPEVPQILIHPYRVYVRRLKPEDLKG